MVRVPQIDVVHPHRALRSIIGDLNERPEPWGDRLAKEDAQLLREFDVPVLRARLRLRGLRQRGLEHRGHWRNEVDLEVGIALATADRLQSGQRVGIQLELAAEGREHRERGMTHVAGETGLSGETRNPPSSGVAGFIFPDPVRNARVRQRGCSQQEEQR